jgi:hypothetical protein
MSSAAETRFRVQAPNSTPREIAVIALDAVSEAVVRRIAGAGWKHATFFTAASRGEIDDESIGDLTGQITRVTDAIDTADLVILIAGPGGHARAASMVGQACSLRRVMTTACIVGVTSASEEALSKTLAQLRPWSLMVVVAKSDDYIDDMMTALRA